MTQRQHLARGNAGRWAGLLAATIAAGPLAIVVATPAQATDQARYVATSGSDASGEGANSCLSAQTPCQTIQHAVDEADAGDIISISAGSYAESVRIRQTLTLIGAGPGSTTVTGDHAGDAIVDVDGADTNTAPAVSISGLALSGNASNRGLGVEDATASLTHGRITGSAGDGIDLGTASTLTVSGTQITGNTDDGINVDSGSTLVASASLITGNTGAGIDLDPGLTPDGTASQITAGTADSTGLTDGTATIAGDGISHNGGGGLVVDSGASASVMRSVFDGNTGAGVVTQDSGTATVARSTVERTVPFPDRDEPFGGGLLALGGSLTARADTVFGNTNFGIALDAASPNIRGGASSPFGARVASASAADEVRVDNTTITATALGTGSALVGGLVHLGTATLSASGTIDAGNHTPDCNAAVTNAGYDLDDDGSCGLKGAGSTSRAGAHLGGLRNNGGPTPTVMPGVRSAARNAIPFGKAGCVAGATDQRGEPRRRPAHGKCDIGAVEAKVANPKLHAKVSGTERHGRYRGKVTVKYHCTLGTAPLTHHCPEPTRLTSSGTHHVKRTIHAIDGGKATVKLTITIS